MKKSEKTVSLERMLFMLSSSSVRQKKIMKNV
jgi:hypothetical protein